MAKTREQAVEFDILNGNWDDHDGFDIELSMKNKLRSQYGYIRTSASIDANNFYHLECFNSEDAADLYDEDPTTNASLLLADVVIPISTAQGDSYGSYLFSTIGQSADIVVREPSLEVQFRFHAVRISSGERLNMGTKGTLTIQRSLDNGSTWNTVGTMEGVINSTDYSNTTTYTTIDLGRFLQKGYKQLIRVRGSFGYTDDNNVDRVGYSTWVQVGSSVTYTELSLECLQGWHTPLFAENIRSVGFPVSYMVNGAVDKTLHILIQGKNGTFEISQGQDGLPSITKSQNNILEVTYDLDETDNGVPFNRDISDASDVYKIFTHGVHAVIAWLTCSDGLGGTLASDVLVNRFMVIDPDTATTPTAPYLMLQNVVSRVTNFVQTKICDYAVFNPVVSGSSITPGSVQIDVTFYVTSYSTNFPNDANVTNYFTFEGKITPGVQHSLTTTIELESDTAGDIQTYFRVWRTSGGTQYNFMQESIGVSNINIAVDNSDSFSPTLGASFLLNPKVRNNSEANPNRILNAQANNAVIESTWTGFDFINDGWVTADDGVKVLRVLAGQSLNFKFNPFAQFLTTPDSSMTFEIDLKVWNVTNEIDPIVRLFETISAGVTNNLRGLQIKPMEGNIFTKSNTIASETNFRFREEQRTHISLNIHNAVVPSVGGDGLYDPNRFTPASKIALVRVFVNGNIEREMKYSISVADEFCTGAMSNDGVTIGQSGANIDIYSIRCYTNRQLDSQAIVKNYIASLPTAEEKLQVRAENAIMTGGRVDVEKVKALGKRVLILHGSEPYQYNTSVASVWWEIFQYDDNGAYIPELSGTICRETGMQPKRQGSTANTYYYSNIQTKIDDGGSITIPLSSLHSSLHVSEPYTAEIDGEQKTVVGIYGGNLGKYDPIQNEAKPYLYNSATGMVTVPDGWIDGNGKYRGMGFMIAENTPLATKLVLKVNYASSMQSHLCGGTRLYNDLHTAVVGRNSLQQAVQTARVAKYTEPVFFFTQADGSDEAVFRGGGNFGAGKMDKPTWGYNKSLHPMFTMIEGSDNNYPLTDMRVPFTIDPNCSEAITYSTEDEGYFYNGLQCLDFDAGKTTNDVPVNALRDRLAEVWNFIYLHSPMVKYFVGTFEQFLLSNDAQSTNMKFWCTEGSDAYLLKRYDFVNNQWVNAGLWNTQTRLFSTIDLRTHEFTAATYTASEHKADYEILNKELVGAIVAHAKKYIGFYFNVRSLQFHYAFQNHFMAGTDNCSKNTYYVIDPTAKSVTIDGETRDCYLFELHQDDVDTILPTDNNGRSTKPYYIDRMHPYDDLDTNQTTSCYEGMYNALFNLVEAMYEETRELQSMLKQIFTAMVGLVTAADNAKGYTNSIWGCLEKYLFSIQRFYPVMAFNEQARIRYEWPALLGYVSQGSGARSIAPITQSMGSQLEAEMQFMVRRVVLMASYAAWGNFYDAGKTYNIGIADAADSFSLQAFHLPNQVTSNNNYSFKVRPHQYIYPTGMLGQTSIDPHVRVAPGEEFTLNLGNTESNDTGMSVLGINYYKSVGNVGDLSVRPDVTFEVKGKRLVEFIAEPTTTYVENSKTVGAFRPNQLNISAKQISVISMNGSGIGGTLDVSDLTRLSSLDLRDTYIYDVELPASEILTTLRFPDTLTKLRVADMPNLETLTLQGADSLQSLVVLQTAGIDTFIVAQQAYTDNAPLNEVWLENIDWSSALIGLVLKLAQAATSHVTGQINIYEPSSSPSVTFDIKKQLVAKWGDIDDEDNDLYITYRPNTLNNIEIGGESYIKVVGTYQYNIVPSSPYANDFRRITWSMSGVNSDYAVLNTTTGELEVKKISQTTLFAAITVVVEKTDGTSLTASINVGLYDRVAEVGDYVYADGSFSNVYNPEKTVVGRCFYINPNDPTDRRMVGCKNLPSDHWGLYDNATNGVSGLSASGALASGYATPYNLPSLNDEGMVDYGSSGISGNSISASNTNYHDGNDFVDFQSGALADIKLREITLATLNVVTPTQFLVEQDVVVGSKIPSGRYNTLMIVKHRNYILDDTNIGYEKPHATSLISETTSLVNCISAVITANDNKNVYRQFYYPAASRCYAYQPTDHLTLKDGEVLSDKFKTHKWYLPSCGELGRLYWYHLKGYTAGVADAIFADPVARGIFDRFTANYYWSSTENGAILAWHVYFSGGIVTGNGKNYSNVVRPVCAF